MKFINNTNKVKFFKIGTVIKNVLPGESIDLPQHSNVSEEGLIAVIEKDIVLEKGYSKTDLIDKTKSEQIKILKSLGLKSKQIKKLTNETKRVNKILELQK